MTDSGHFRAGSRPRAALAISMFRAGDGDEHRISAFTDNIGTGGLFANTFSRFELGERVEVEFATPSTWTPQRFQAEVVRTQDGDDGRHQGVGLKFVDMSDAQAVVLAELITSLDFEG